MNRKQRFYLNGAILTAVNLALKGVGLFFSAYVAKAIGAEGVGLNALVMTLYAFAVTLASSGISLSVTRLTAAALADGSADADASSVLNGAFVYSTLFGCGSAALLYFLSDYLAGAVIHFPAASSALKALALSLPPVAFGGVVSGYFIAARRVLKNAVVQVLGQLMRVGLTVWLIAVLASSGVVSAVFAISLGALISEWCCFIISFAVFALDRRGKNKRGRGGFNPVAKTALPLAVSTYVRSLFLTLEHSLIPKRLMDRGEGSSEALSNYGILHGMALPLVLYPLAPLSSFSGLLVPEFAEEEARGDKEKMRRIAKAASERTLTYATVVAVLLFFFSEELGYLIYNSFEAGKFIAFLAPVLPIMYLDHVVDGALKGIGEQVYSMWVNIADAALSVILVYFLIPIMGIVGYAVVIIGMEAFNFCLSFSRLRKRVRFSISLFHSLVLPFSASSLSALITDILFISEGSGTTVLLIVIKLIFTLGATLGILALYNLLTAKKAQKPCKKSNGKISLN